MAWKVRIRRVGFEPSKYSYVCSKHFKKEDFTEPSKDTPTVYQKPRLKRGAIPSLFLRGESSEEVKSRSTATSLRALKPLKESPKKKLAASGGALLDETDTEMFLAQADQPHEEQRVESLTKQLDEAFSEIRELEKRVFTFERLSEDDIKGYTNLSKRAFLRLDKLINAFRPLKYWTGCEVVKISDKDQLLIFLMKLKLDVPLFDIAKRYDVSRTTIHNVFLTYLYAVHEVLYQGLMKRMPSLAKNQGSMHESFGEFTNCRVIIDCTEFRITTPRQDLNAASASYSNYKHNLTGKFLIGVAPNGTITFVSDGYPGNTSDKVLTEHCGVLNHLKVSNYFIK